MLTCTKLYCIIISILTDFIKLLLKTNFTHQKTHARRKDWNILMFKKTVSLILMAALAIMTMASCKPAPKKVTVNVKVVGHNSALLFEGSAIAVQNIGPDGQNPVIADLLVGLNESEAISNLKMNDTNTSIEQIGDFKNQEDASATGVFFWTYSINGAEQVDDTTDLVDPSVDQIKEGDQIIIHYSWMKYVEESKK